MKLRAADDGHNVYVLYSDLLFNLLILFLIILLALVLRMNATMQAVSHAATAPTSEPAEVWAGETPQEMQRELQSLGRMHRQDLDRIATDKSIINSLESHVDIANTKASKAEQEIRSLRVSLAASQARTDQAVAEARSGQEAAMAAMSRKLAIAAGSNRFSGRSGSTCMCVAVDLSRGEPEYVLVNASAFASAAATLDGESDEQHKARSGRVLHDAIDGAPRFSEDQLRGIFQATETKPVRTGSESSEGELYFSYGGNPTLVASGWENRAGEVDEGSIPFSIRRKIADGTFAAYHEELINRLVRLRDNERPAKPPQSVPVLHFSSNDDRSVILVGQSQYAVNDFRQIVSSFGQGGVILQYDSSSGEVCPEWIVSNVLTRTGYTNAVPDPDELKRLRKSLSDPVRK